jgi:hypothetical protein
MSNYWNIETTYTYINNLSLNYHTTDNIDNLIKNICDKIEKFVSCKNKKNILLEFTKDSKNIKSSDEFIFILNKLKQNIFNNSLKSI